MGIFDRVILTLYAISLTFISFMIMLVALGWDVPFDYIRTSLANPGGRWSVGLLATAFFVVSLRLLYYAFRRRHPSQTVVHETALGEVRIALDAIENLVRRAARQVTGVREVKASVTSNPAGIAVGLRATVSPEVNIPSVSDEIQNTIKNYVRNVVGIGVAEVKIYVENISDEVRRGRLD